MKQQNTWLADLGLSAVPFELYRDRGGNTAKRRKVKETRKPYVRVLITNEQRNAIRDAVQEIMSKGERSNQKIYDALMDRNLITTADGNISYFTIRNYTKEYLRNFGVKRKRTKEEVMRLGKAGIGVEEICSTLKIQRFVVRNYLLQAGLLSKE